MSVFFLSIVFLCVALKHVHGSLPRQYSYPSVTISISNVSSLDNEGNPTNIEVLSYQSSEHYYWNGEERYCEDKWLYYSAWNIEKMHIKNNYWYYKRQYICPNSTTKIYISKSNDTAIVWGIMRGAWVVVRASDAYKVDNLPAYEGFFYAECSNTILHQCNSWNSTQSPISEISVVYCVKTANGYLNEYVYNEIVNNHWSFRAIHDDSVIYYDANTKVWEMSAQIDENIKLNFGQCNMYNIFNCTLEQSSIWFTDCELRITNPPSTAPTSVPTPVPTIQDDLYPIDIKIKTYIPITCYYYSIKRTKFNYYSWHGEYVNGERVYIEQSGSQLAYTGSRWMTNSRFFTAYTNGTNSFQLVDADKCSVWCDKKQLLECNDELTVVFCVTASISSGEYYVMDAKFNNRWVLKRLIDSIDPVDQRYIYYHLGNQKYDIQPGWKVSDTIGSDFIYAECNKNNIFNCTIPETGIDIGTCITRPTASPTLECQDLYDEYHSNDGVSRIISFQRSFNSSYGNFKFINSNTDWYIANKEILYQKTITCNKTVICYVG
eukprot:517409_1